MVVRNRKSPVVGGKCDGHNRQGKRCGRPAGWGTDHPGVGKCKMHGGKSPVKHGLYSATLQTFLKKREGEWDKAAAQASDLSAEIEALRALAEHVTRSRKVEPEDFLKVMDRIVKAVSAQQQAQRQGMVSLETVRKYIEAVGMVIAKHVKEPSVLERIDADCQAIPLLAS